MITFPDEILLILFAEAISKPKEFVRVALVCKKWNELSNHINVWKGISSIVAEFLRSQLSPSNIGLHYLVHPE